MELVHPFRFYIFFQGVLYLTSEYSEFTCAYNQVAYGATALRTVIATKTISVGVKQLTGSLLPSVR